MNTQNPYASGARIYIQFTGYWLSGTGVTRGRHVDAVTHRDQDNLPAMPMTQVKGQLRETAERLAAIESSGWDSDKMQYLFGGRPSDPSETILSGNEPGALSFAGEAQLTAETRAFLNNHPAEKVKLFRRVASTAIGKHGVALDKTLRAIEVVVPVRLEGVIDWIGDAPPRFDWLSLIDTACAATLAFGKLKADGYGRAIASAGGSS